MGVLVTTRSISRFVPKLSLRTTLYFSSVPTIPKDSEVQIYTYKICPFCCKSKAFLHYFQVRYNDVEVSPLSKRQLSWSKDYKKVPIAVFANDKVICDSSSIVEEILDLKKSRLCQEFTSEEAKYWESWSTDRLAVLMYPNMTRSFAECRQLLSYYNKVKNIGKFDAFLVQNIGALGMAFAHGKIKKKYGLDNERAALWAVLDEFIQKLEERDHKFLGGNQPNIGDLSIYGVLSSADGIPLYHEISSYGSGRLGDWMLAMQAKMPAPKLMS